MFVVVVTVNLSRNKPYCYYIKAAMAAFFIEDDTHKGLDIDPVVYYSSASLLPIIEMML